MCACASPFHIAFQTLKHTLYTHTHKPHFREYIRSIFFYYPASHEKLMKTLTRFVRWFGLVGAFCISPLMKDNQKSIHTHSLSHTQRQKLAVFKLSRVHIARAKMLETSFMATCICSLSLPWAKANVCFATIFFRRKKNQVKYLHRECVFLLKKYANWSHSARLSLIHLNEWDERERNREKSSFSRYNQKSLNYRCRNLYFLISIFGDSISGSSVKLKWLQVFHVLHIFDGKFAFFSSAQLQFQAKRERNSQIDALQPKTIFDKQENGREKEEEQAVSRRQIVWHFRHVLPLLDYISCKEWTRPKLNFGKYFGWYAFRSRQTLFFLLFFFACFAAQKSLFGLKRFK